MRTLVAIVRGCFITIFACVFQAVHPDLSNPNARHPMLNRWKDRLLQTYMSLIVPEFMVLGATRQRSGAKFLKRKVDEMIPSTFQWTMTHAHFIQMGGFAYRNDDQEVKALFPHTFLEYLKAGRLVIEELRLVTEADIKDKSKGNIISKGLVITQTMWFVFECLARLHQKLPLVKLEVITLAFAVLTTLMYIQWWSKP
ncbi:hypothetical protein BDN72DRAFT_769944, partial [Pluteus cervinus]